MPIPGLRLCLAAVLALAVGATALAFASPGFVAWALNADSLYPALLAEDLRADPAALLRFRPSRIPSLIPDLLLAVSLDLLTGDWRLAFWGYGAAAFALLALLGGWVAGRVAGVPARAAAVTLALLMAVPMLAGLPHFAWLARQGPVAVLMPGEPVNLWLMLALPVYHGGAFIGGLGLVALAWRAVETGRAAAVAFLGLLAAGLVASNLIVIAHAVLPVAIALGEGVLRRRIAPRRAAAIAAPLALGSVVGVALGLVLGREDLPGTGEAGVLANIGHAIAALPTQPYALAMVLASLPVAFAFLRPARAAAWLARCSDPRAARFFVTVAAAACAAGALITAGLYYTPLGWRYGNPLAWWPLILGSAVLTPRLAGWLRAIAAGAAAGSLVLLAIALAAGPALLSWQHPVARCLDAADPGHAWGAGLADYWNARMIAASGQWRRQVEQLHADGRAARFINDPRSLVQHRHAAPGTPPPYRFIAMERLQPEAIRRIYGPPGAVLPCGQHEIWVYPPGHDLAARLRAASAELARWQ